MMNGVAGNVSGGRYAHMSHVCVVMHHSWNWNACVSILKVRQDMGGSAEGKRDLNEIASIICTV
jgi:hypothetical protein